MRRLRRLTQSRQLSESACLKTILVPTDFSLYARRAADRAIRMGSGARHVHLVCVHQQPRFGDAAPRAEVARKLANEATRLERKIRAQGSRVKVGSRLLTGEPYVAIIRHSREIEADVIVLGSKGAGERPEKVLGRTAARVARMAETPVLVVRRIVNAPYRRPLVALPLDPSARRLVKLAQAASDPAASITAVRSYNVPFPGLIDAGSDAAPTAYHKEFRRKVDREVRALLASIERQGPRIRKRLREGDARGVILSEAARMKADLVALGTHGRSGLAHMLIGSVAEWVMVHASADVLVARPVRFTFEIP